MVHAKDPQEDQTDKVGDREREIKHGVGRCMSDLAARLHDINAYLARTTVADDAS